MKIVVGGADLAGLPTQVRSFLMTVWEPPDADGTRKVREIGQNESQVAQGLAAFLSVAVTDAQRSTQAWQLRINEDSHVFFERVDRLHHAHDSAARDLIAAYNDRRDLGTCQTCGSVFMPDRRRVARFCSNKCRNDWHQKKGKE